MWRGYFLVNSKNKGTWIGKRRVKSLSEFENHCCVWLINNWSMKEGTKWRRMTTECRKFRKHSRARNVEVISQEELFIHLGNSRSLTELQSYQSLYDIGGYLKKQMSLNFPPKVFLSMK